MRLLKQIMSIVLVAVLLFSGVTVSVQAEDIVSDAGAEQGAAELLEQEDVEKEEIEKEEIETEQAAPDINSGENLSDAAPQITKDASQTEEASVENIVNTVAESCLAACTTEFDKVLWLHDWILEHAEWDESAGDGTAADVLTGGAGNCEAYHNAYAMLLDRVGIQAGRVEGGGHVWTAVKMDGAWYQVDAALDDRGGAEAGYKKYLYFGLTDELMRCAHPEHVSVGPGFESLALDNNYFIKTGKIKDWSVLFEEEIRQNIAEGKAEFVLTIPGNMIGGAEEDIICFLTAYQLSKEEWDTEGLSVLYQNQQLICRLEKGQAKENEAEKSPEENEVRKNPEEKSADKNNTYSISSRASQLELGKNKTESVINMKLSNILAEGNAKIKFAVWGEAGGQNDLNWYPAKTAAKGVYEAQAQVSAHKEAGKYIVHAYAEQNGTQTFLAGGTVKISGLTAGKMSWNKKETSVEDGKYRIELEDVKSPASVQSVRAAVWSESNGQDDLEWYNAKKSGNKWYLDVEVKKHKYRTGCYFAHTYAADNRGISHFVGGITFTAGKMKANRLVIQKNKAESTITVSMDNISGNDPVTFAVWGEAGGQNDLCWYPGRKTGERAYEAQIPVSAHQEAGRYLIHVYGEHNGALNFLSGGAVKITGISAGSVSRNEKKSIAKDGKYRLEARNIKSPASIQNVRIAVWSDKNGQDDIRWYDAKKSGDMWCADADVCYHKFDDGIYHAHAYAEDSRGIQQFAGAVNFLVSKVKRNQLNISMDKEQRYMTITLKAAGADGIVEFPVWGVSGGQNDVIWHKGNRVAPYTYQAVVDISEHKEVGKYLIHAYSQVNGTRSFLAGGSITVKGIVGGKMEASVNRDIATIDVKVSGITGPSAIAKVSAGVWTSSGGQDDLQWYEAVKKKDGWYVTVDTAKHNFETGSYNIHMYATDNRGIRMFAGGALPVMKPADRVKISAKIGAGGTNVTITGTGIRGAESVRMAVWGNVNGQNDLLWYTMSRSVGIKYQGQIDLYDHLETGKYLCHVYAVGGDGVSRCMGGTEFKVDKLNSNHLRILDTDNINGKCNAKLYFPKGKKKITGIRMAVWTQANGQDDIFWYNASASGDVWNAVIDSLNHKCESGIYNIHAYGKAADGSEEFLAGTAFHMTRTTRRYQNPGQYYQIADSISLSGGGYNLSYGYEGVKVMKVIRCLGLGSGIGMGGAFYSQNVANAVASFQRRVGLPATGTVDLLTWLHMGYTEAQWNLWGAYVSPVRVNKNSTRQEHIEAMISTAYSYMGTPYVIGASGPPGTGIDCSGLVMQALYGAGLDISPMNPVRHAHPGYEYESRNIWASPHLMHVDYSQRQRGDLIFYQSNSGVIIHVAIYLGNNMVIESWPNQVVVWPIGNAQRSNVRGVVRPFV